MQEETEENDSNDVPPDIFFPVELSRHLKDELNRAQDENWKLKQHIDFQQQQISQLKIPKMREPEETKDYSQHLMSSKLIDVNRKNREMTAKMESMKSKMQLLMDANEKLKDRVQELERNAERGDNQSRDFSVSSSQRTDEEIVTSTQELNLANSKMMQYRLTCQQLRIDLRTALRALAQEVGDGVTPKDVLKVVSNTSVAWRGRQQQIIALNQKLAEAQVKMLEYKQNAAQHHQAEPHVMGAGGEGGELEHDVQTSENNGGELNKTFSGFSGFTPGMSQFQRRLSGLQQQEKKKFDTLEKVTQECEATKLELKSIQMEAKASKARIQTLEGQVRTYRLQVEGLQSKFNQKQAESDSNWNELVTLKQEFMALKEREKALRETSSTEIRESQQALTRERAVIVRLQDVIAKKQESVEKLESEVVRLQTNLDSCCSVPKTTPVGRESESRIATLEDQLIQAAKAMQELENERQRLLKVMSDAVDRAEAERLSHSNTHRHLIKAFEVLKQSDSCIERCLESAQITNKAVLQEVEAIRSLMRELKTGSLFSLENEQLDDVRNLKSKVRIMTNEIAMLKHHLNKSADERGMDLQQFSILADKMRSELYCVLQKAVSSLRVRNS